MTAKPRLPGLIFAGMMLAALAARLAGAAEIFDPKTDGWHSWSVPAPPGAGEQCCTRWSGAGGIQTRCDLDRDRGRLTRHTRFRDDSDSTRVYVLMEAGVATRVDALSPHCEVRTATAMTDHGHRDSRTSVDWLRRFVASDSRVGSEALAALSLHGGDHALQALIDVVESDADGGLREEALFWLIQSGSDAGFAYVDRLLTAD